MTTPDEAQDNAARKLITDNKQGCTRCGWKNIAVIVRVDRVIKDLPVSEYEPLCRSCAHHRNIPGF